MHTSTGELWLDEGSAPSYLMQSHTSLLLSVPHHTQDGDDNNEEGDHRIHDDELVERLLDDDDGGGTEESGPNHGQEAAQPSS